MFVTEDLKGNFLSLSSIIATTRGFQPTLEPSVIKDQSTVPASRTDPQVKQSMFPTKLHSFGDGNRFPVAFLVIER